MSQKASPLRAIFASNVRDRRKQLGYSQEELADRCGLHRTYVGAIERAERNVSIDNIYKISAALEIAAGSMLSESPPPAGAELASSTGQA